MALLPKIQLSPSVGSDETITYDEMLMDRISHNQQNALSELYSRYGHMLRGLISSVVREESEAEDVLQESLLQIWREARTYSPKLGRPLWWVVTIARRRAIDRVRRRQSYRRAKQRFEDETRVAIGSGLEEVADSMVSSTDLRRFLDRQIETLPPEQREAIELAYFSGMSQSEIAAVTQTPLGTVKTRLQLGLQKLTRSVRPLRQKI